MTPIAAMKRSRVRLYVFGVLWILILINFLDRTVLPVALPYINDDFPISSAEKGWILGAFFWTYLVLQIPGGWLLDKVGPRRVVAITGTLWGAVELVTGFATGAIYLLLTRLGLGVTEAPVYPAASKLNANWLPPKERARGATILDAASPAGAAFGGLLATFLIGALGSWRWAFIVTGALTIIIAVLYYLYLRDTPEQHNSVNSAELDHIRSARDVGQTDDEQATLPKVRDYTKSLSFWGMWFGRLGWALTWWGIISWTPSYLVDALHFDLAKLGWGTFFIYGMGFVGEIASGFATDYFRSRTTRYNAATKIPLIISGVVGGGTVAIMPLINNGYIAVLILGISVFFILFGGLYWAIPSWLAPKQQVGTIGGVMNVASAAGGGLAPVIMGYAITAGNGSYVGAFIFLALAAVLYLVGSLLINFNRPLARARLRNQLTTRGG
jgi:ACS family D-galactonate transporter-like MFS transporter